LGKLDMHKTSAAKRERFEKKYLLLVVREGFSGPSARWAYFPGRVFYRFVFERLKKADSVLACDFNTTT